MNSKREHKLTAECETGSPYPQSRSRNRNRIIYTLYLSIDDANLKIKKVIA